MSTEAAPRAALSFSRIEKEAGCAVPQIPFKTFWDVWAARRAVRINVHKCRQCQRVNVWRKWLPSVLLRRRDDAVSRSRRVQPQQPASTLLLTMDAAWRQHDLRSAPDGL